MNPAAMQLRSKLLRLTRRWWLYRTAETIGMSMIGATIAGVVIVPLLAWQGDSSWAVTALLLLMAFLIGAIIAWHRKPTILQTAIKADQQLKLSDLLATAFTLDESRHGSVVDPGIGNIIVSQAAVQLASMSAGDLVLNRFGSRAWIGIGLSTALLICVTAMCSHPLVLTAAENRIARTSNQDERLYSPATGMQSRTGERNSPPASKDDGRDDADEGGKTAASASASQGDFKPGTSSGGAANASANDASVPTAASTAQSSTTTGDQSNGGSGRGSSTSVDGANSGLVSQNKSDAASTAPWQSDRWPAQSSSAMESLNSNPPPPVYRDLIRDYFSR